MKRILILNGPNLNLLGKRETNIYGSESFEDFYDDLKQIYSADFQLSYFQTNVEGEMVNKIQEVGFEYTAIILNAGGYTHTSVAIRDAISAITTPVIECTSVIFTPEKNLGNIHCFRQFVKE